MLWGLTVKPGIQTSGLVIEQEIQLTMVAIESRGVCDKKDGGCTQVILHTEQGEYILCTLVAGQIYQQNLDIKLRHGEKFCFSAEGVSTVHITGYSLVKDFTGEISVYTVKGNRNIVSSWKGEEEVMTVDDVQYEQHSCPKCGWETCECMKEEVEHVVTADTEDTGEEDEAVLHIKRELEAGNVAIASDGTKEFQSIQLSTAGSSKDIEGTSSVVHEGAVPVMLAKDVNDFPKKLMYMLQQKMEDPQGTDGKFYDDDELLRKSAKRIENEKEQLRMEAMQLDNSGNLGGIIPRSVRESLNKGPFKCSYCPKSFAQQRYCRDHEYIHIKPYMCRYCGKDFAKAYNCRKHEMTHTGEKPYRCSICGMKFTDASSRSRHERAHQGKTPYNCRYCKRGFSRRDYCEKHELSHKRSSSKTSLDSQQKEYKDRDEAV